MSHTNAARQASPSTGSLRHSLSPLSKLRLRTLNVDLKDDENKKKITAGVIYSAARSPTLESVHKISWRPQKEPRTVPVCRWDGCWMGSSSGPSWCLRDHLGVCGTLRVGWVPLSFHSWLKPRYAAAVALKCLDAPLGVEAPTSVCHIPAVSQWEQPTAWKPCRPAGE